MPRQYATPRDLPQLCRRGMILALSLAVMGCASGAHNHQDPWLAPDKALHLLAGAAVGVTGAGIARSRGFSSCGATSAGVGLAFSIGLAKEWHDRRYNSGTASGRDLAATIIGGLIGAQLVGECHR
jgi:uncharacterized protein YfiM (DUF2279 family)